MKRLALVLVLGACDGARLQPTADDCQAVLAHLVVLEADSTPVMCKYHPNCSGEDDDHFLSACPKVLTRQEQLCYQHATTIVEADACLEREVLAKRIDTGEVEELITYGATGWDDGLYLDFSPEARALAELRTFRDDACQCGDRTCADRVSDRLRTLMERWEKVGDRASKSIEREGQRVFGQYERCLEAARARP